MTSQTGQRTITIYKFFLAFLSSRFPIYRPIEAGGDHPELQTPKQQLFWNP